MAAKVSADMWFDPLCPWAWITSRWLLEVEQVRPVTARFHVMSLAVLNEHKENKPAAKNWGPVRVCVAASKRYGEPVLRELYTAYGNRIHLGKEEIDTQLHIGALSDAGLDVSLAEAAESTEYDEALRESHRAGMAPVGLDVGTPTIHTAGADGQPVAFFGPVITPAPKGEAAGQLWDGVILLAGTPGFYELKRTREQDPIFD